MRESEEREVAQSCPTLSYPMDCSLPGSAIRGIFQARVLEWGAITFSSSARRTMKIKSVTVSIVFLSICYEVKGPDVMILVF